MVPSELARCKRYGRTVGQRMAVFDGLKDTSRPLDAAIRRYEIVPD